jgi:sugar lactone lactonase YvrE
MLIVAETFANRLTAFDIAADGTLSNRRFFARLEGCFPDGICLDAEGAVWVADARSPRVIRVFDGGHIDRTLSIGARLSFACMLGGPDRRTLFVWTVRVETPGAGWP